MDNNTARRGTVAWQVSVLSTLQGRSVLHINMGHSLFHTSRGFKNHPDIIAKIPDKLVDDHLASLIFRVSE